MLYVPSIIQSNLQKDHCYKNIRIHFPNGEREDICNDLIVKDSVSFKESLCSQDTLKFGLCEASVFECETVGVGNIKGATIEVYCEVECEPVIGQAVWRVDLQKYVMPIPYGTFIVSECKRQSDLNHRRIVAYGGIAYIKNDYPDFALELFNTKFQTGGQNFTYTPYAFLFALSGLQFKLYSNDIFDSTTTSGTIIPGGVGSFSNIRNDHGGGYFKLSLSGDYQSTGIAEGQLIQINREINNDNLQYVVDVLYDLVLEFGTETTSGVKITKKDICDALSYVYFPINTTSGGTTYMSGITVNDPKFPYVCYPFINSIFSQGVRVNKSVTRAEIYWHYNGTDTLQKAITIDQSNVIANNEFTKLTVNEEYESLLVERLNFEVVNDDPWYHILKSGDYNAQETINSIVELRGEFATVKRSGNCFRLLNIKKLFGLNPGETLYPDTDLYPQAAVGGKLLPQDYQSCWYDDEYAKRFGAIQCQYKNTDNEGCLFILYLTGFDAQTPTDSYKTYDFSDNQIIKAGLWTEAQIQAFCEVIAGNIEGVTYMPVEFVGRGLPYVEAGDTFEILTKSNDNIITIVLNRTISGEQTLTDSYKSV